MSIQSGGATMQIRESGINTCFLPHQYRGIDKEMMAVRQEERL